jgi:hypothetical protein
MMAKNAATEDALGELHATVARVLTSAIATQGEEVTAATLSVAVTFLKNNNITADPSSNAELAELTAALAARRKDGKGKLKEMQMAEEQFHRSVDMPGSLQ